MARRTLDQQYYAIEAAHCYNILLDQREIFLSGEVDEEGELGSGFIKNLRLLVGKDSKKPIVVHQHSLGGDWCTGMMIRDAIAQCPAPIIFVCHGLAASMGSIIPMGCLKHGDAYRINMPSCDWLIHEGYTGVSWSHTHKQAQSGIEWEKRLRTDMLDWFVLAGKGGEKWKDWTDRRIRTALIKKLDSKEDWWLDARQAVEYGFADAVMGDEGFESIEAILSHWKE